MDKAIKKFNTLTPRQKTYVALGFFAFLILIFYGNTLANGFVMDDLVQIENNAQVHSIKNLPGTLVGCQAAGITGSCKGRTFNYRPTFFASTILSWQLGGRAESFHFVNLVYFFIVVVLLFYFVKLLTKDYVLAFLSALIFLVHPINSEVVNWASAQIELLLAIFVLSSLISFVLYRKTKKHKYLVPLYLFYFLGLLTKEPAVFVPLIALMLDLTVFRMHIKKLLRMREIRTYLLFGAPVILYVIMRLAIVGAGTSGGFVQFTFAERVYADVTLFAQYIWKLFYPLPLSAFHYFETSHNFTSFEFVSSILIALGFFALAGYLFKIKQYFLLIFFVWFLLFLSPVLIFVDSVGENVFSERYLFLPAMAFSILLASFALWVFRTYQHLVPPQPLRIAVALLTLAIIGATWGVAFERNQDWRDVEVLYVKTLEQNPRAHNIRRDLAFAYFERGKLTDSRLQFEELIERAPEWGDITMAYKGLGDYWRAVGDKEKALSYYIRGTQTGTSARDFVTYNDAGVLFMDQEEYLLGFSYFCQAVQLFPESAVAQDNFNDAIGALEEMLLDGTILQEAVLDTFVEDPDQKITFLDSRCDDAVCQFAFPFQAQEAEILPPFLIFAQTSSGALVEITNKAYSAEQGLIVLDTDAIRESEDISFIFPTCSRTYYEATTQ